MNYFKLESADIKAIEQMSDLASNIVKEHYDPILGVEQNDYMIKQFQSVLAITEQLEHGYDYYFVSDDAGNKVGFLAFFPREKDIYLSKFYLQKGQRGKGISKNMLKFVAEKTKKAGLCSIILNVNKYNSAVLFYEKLGFVRSGEEKNDIGNGYFMDDFVYKYTVN